MTGFNGVQVFGDVVVSHRGHDCFGQMVAVYLRLWVNHGGRQLPCSTFRWLAETSTHNYHQLLNPGDSRGSFPGLPPCPSKHLNSTGGHFGPFPLHEPSSKTLFAMQAAF